MPKQRERNALPSAERIARDDHQRFAVRLAFDGTTYRGFQSQPDGNSIQDQLEHRLRNLLRRRARVAAWGRTDGGAHARGALVTVDLSVDEVAEFARRRSTEEEGSEEEGGSSSDAAKASRFLHSVLKEFACNSGVDAAAPRPQARCGSIRARRVTPVPRDFDARYSALWKRYAYYVCAGGGDNGGGGGDRLPFAWTRYAWQIDRSLDSSAMVDAAELLGGGEEHNFEWMCVTQRGELRDPRRTVRLGVETVPMNGDETGDVPYFVQRPAGATIYKITGACDFFLYKMMRRIVGVLVAVGKNDADLDTLKRCVDAYDNDDVDANRTKVRIPDKLLQTAPAKGLCLEHVEYDIPI